MNPEKVQARPSQFEDIPENEIIELTSYHRRDFDLAVIRINPHDHEHARSSISQPLEPLSTSTGLGQLQLLHLELIHEVCLYLDIESLFRFRKVSRCAQQYVSTSRFYRETTTHALDALCVLLRTKVANRFTLAELFAALCTRDCTLCSSSFGGFLFLPTLLRCCFSCLPKGRLPQLVPYTDAKWYISSKSKTKSSGLASLLPVLRTIPGIYSMQEVSIKGRKQLVTMDDLIRIVGSKPSSDEEAIWTAARSYSNLPFMATTALPYLDRASGRVEEGVSCSGCQVSLEEALTEESRLGPDGLGIRDRVYSHEGFIGHFRECLKAQEVWKLRKNGTSVAGISEFVRRRGYFKERDVVMSFHPDN
ncbi:hypothetical protein CBS63078_6805 [Aspergillus niger]|nr:hypothetical protein CBS133816_9192 [Aspergillus niger]KAI2900980.1 hypothetical protein CBS63078_6805 [Aspergillus niger]KAI2960964.1 hypothetical protein CBS147323_7916 [Aspergillus niger]KAI2966602.1 hypothetical protein CBS147324_7359 [Aspergillus niger]KAI3019204.1 hypothetical protein CBS147347_9276 [Aspergillus niger]